MARDAASRAPWILLPCVLLTLSGVTLLAPRQSAQADSPPAAASPKPPAAVAYDDGDGDELLEHWDNAKYSTEERVQIAGASAGFLLLGIVVWRKRTRSPQPQARLTLVDVSEPIKAEVSKPEPRKAA